MVPSAHAYAYSRSTADIRPVRAAARLMQDAICMPSHSQFIHGMV